MRTHVGFLQDFDIYCFRLVRSPFNAISQAAARPSPNVETLKLIRESTLGRNPSSVKFARRLLQLRGT
jgi:hypothetical protein